MAGNVIFCIENSKKKIWGIKALLEQISEFGKVTGYKINIWESVYLYILAWTQGQWN